jgi:hypothetical protein
MATVLSAFEKVQTASLSQTLSERLGTPYPAEGVNPFRHIDNNLRSGFLFSLETMVQANRRGLGNEVIQRELDFLRSHRPNINNVRYLFNQVNKGEPVPFSPPLAPLNLNSILFPFLTLLALNHFLTPEPAGPVQMASIGGFWAVGQLMKGIRPLFSAEDSPGMGFLASYKPKTLAGKMLAASPIDAVLEHIQFLLKYDRNEAAKELATSYAQTLWSAIRSPNAQKWSLDQWTAFYPASQAKEEGPYVIPFLQTRVRYSAALIKLANQAISQNERQSYSDQWVKAHQLPVLKTALPISLSVHFVGHYRVYNGGVPVKMVEIHISPPVTVQSLLAHLRRRMNEMNLAPGINWFLRINGTTPNFDQNPSLTAADRIELFFASSGDSDIRLVPLSGVKAESVHAHAYGENPATDYGAASYLFSQLQKGLSVGSIKRTQMTSLQKDFYQIQGQFKRISQPYMRRPSDPGNIRRLTMIFHKDIFVSGGPLALRLAPGTAKSPLPTLEFMSEYEMVNQIRRETEDIQKWEYYRRNSYLPSVIPKLVGGLVLILVQYYMPNYGSVSEASMGGLMGLVLLTSFLGRWMPSHMVSQPLARRFRTAA